MRNLSFLRKGVLKKYAASTVNNPEGRVLSGDSPDSHLVAGHVSHDSRDAAGRSWLFRQARKQEFIRTGRLLDPGFRGEDEGVGVGVPSKISSTTR
ncbi:MAG: hypothetical protein ABIE70_08675 [bacterium]